MKTGLTLTLLLSILATAPGCSKFRQLTRRDYASLNDPFVDKAAVKAETESGLKTAATGPAVASPGGSPGETTAAPSAAGRASTAQNGTADAGGERSGGVSNAVAGKSGPSLEDFISTETGLATAAANAATNAVAESRHTPDSAEFAAFLEDQAEASGLTQTARELDDGFLEFANNKKKEWQQRTAQAAQAANAAAAATNPMRQVSQSVTQNAQTALSPTMRPSASTETAVPLIRQAAAARQQSMPAAMANSPVGRPLREGNPFADQMPEFPETDTIPATPSATAASFATRTRIPGAGQSNTQPSSVGTSAATVSERSTAGAADRNQFSSFDHSSVPQKPAQKSPIGTPSPFAEDAATQTGGPFLDSGFNFDSGWKPPSMQRP